MIEDSVHRGLWERGYAMCDREGIHTAIVLTNWLISFWGEVLDSAALPPEQHGHYAAIIRKLRSSLDVLIIMDVTAEWRRNDATGR